MRIRQAVDADVAAVTALVARAYAGYVTRIGRAPAPIDADYVALVDAGEVWVGDVDGQIVGVVVLRPAAGVLELENVAVDPPTQGAGHGRALISFAEDHGRQLGLACVELYTNEAMTENLELYPRLGYVETERRSEAGFQRVYFRKSLDLRAEGH
jgi:ribosomal protein S18 acetylase RimI-like enzyme